MWADGGCWGLGGGCGSWGGLGAQEERVGWAAGSMAIKGQVWGGLGTERPIRGGVRACPNNNNTNIQRQSRPHTQ